MKPDSAVSQIWAQALRLGWQAARANLWPAFVVQAVMFLLVLGYYLHWPINGFLQTLAEWSARGGAVFSFVSSGFSAGILSEALKVLVLQRGCWRRENTHEAVYKFLMIGFGGWTASLLYALQDRLFGSELNWQTILIKVCIDQFVFNPFFAAPLPCIINQFRHDGLSWATLRQCLRVRFFVENVLPLLVTTWFFWIPMVSLIYSLPATLQFPLFLCAITIWGMLFTSLMAKRDKH